jgi:hypothetical protein
VYVSATVAVVILYTCTYMSSQICYSFSGLN